MANEEFPLLFFPAPTETDRNPLGGGGGAVHVPGIGRQRARIAPQLAALQQAFDAKRLALQQAAPLENPELVLVLEIAGTVQNFAKAVSKVPGLDWLIEWAEEQIDPDEDFFVEGREHEPKPYSGRLFLLGSNYEALQQLLNLWNRYSQNPDADFARGLAPFKHVFAQLRTIRYWNSSDRVDSDMRRYWQDRLDDGLTKVRFEIEAWYFAGSQKNEASRVAIQSAVLELGGRILRRALIPEIAYHGFLVELPAPAVGGILNGAVPELVLSDRIMFFQPKAQAAVIDGMNEASVVAQPAIEGGADGPPVVAVLDGLPLGNHPLLQNRLMIDDPDDWAANYEAKDRVHGTAMASLIVHGELDRGPSPLNRKLYVRPIMRPDPTDNFHVRRREHTPDDELLIDLMLRAVKRICEGDAGQAAAAPTVRIINLSVGDDAQLFVREMSPWARLLDWLAVRYSLLFIVSAGNDLRSIRLNTPLGTLAGMAGGDREALAFTELTRDSTTRRLIAPAEAINVLTVGAVHDDLSHPSAVPARFDLFARKGISPISRVGHGYRRSVKPDILMSGGRVLYRERIQGGTNETTLDVVTVSVEPGHRVALPPLQGQVANATAHSRGTSNAAALASRAAAQTYDILENLRIQIANAPDEKFDAVLLKALMVHGAKWGDLPQRLLAERPEFQSIVNGNTRRLAEKDFVTRWLGYGLVDGEVVSCTAQRVTLIGVGQLGADEAFIFSAPLPPGIAGKKVWRRLTVTLAWMSPINFSHQGYRRAKLWVTPPQEQLRIKRTNGVHEKAALRGTIQHEILEGEEAVAFVDGDRFECKVNCAADAGELSGKVAFALCVSLEVRIDSQISLYQEIRQRIMQPVPIQAGANGT